MGVDNGALVVAPEVDPRVSAVSVVERRHAGPPRRSCSSSGPPPWGTPAGPATASTTLGHDQGASIDSALGLLDRDVLLDDRQHKPFGIEELTSRTHPTRSGCIPPAAGSSGLGPGRLLNQVGKGLASRSPCGHGDDHDRFRAANLLTNKCCPSPIHTHNRSPASKHRVASRRRQVGRVTRESTFLGRVSPW